MPANRVRRKTDTYGRLTAEQIERYAAAERYATQARLAGMNADDLEVWRGWLYRMTDYFRTPERNADNMRVLENLMREGLAQIGLPDRTDLILSYSGLRELQERNWDKQDA